MGRRRALIAALLAVAITALGAGSRAGGMPLRDPVVHAPAIAGGPTGRIALDGVWTVRVVPSAATGRVHLPYSPNATAVSGPAGEAGLQGAVACTGARSMSPPTATTRSASSRSTTSRPCSSTAGAS